MAEGHGRRQEAEAALLYLSSTLVECQSNQWTSLVIPALYILDPATSEKASLLTA